MRLNYNAIEPYAVWRFGYKWKKASIVEKKEDPTRKYSSDGTKFRPNSKMSKRLLRKAIKSSVRAQRIAENAGKAEQRLEKGVLKDKYGNEIKHKTRYFK